MPPHRGSPGAPGTGMIRGRWREGDPQDAAISSSSCPCGPRSFVHHSTTPGQRAKKARLPPSAPCGEQMQELSWVWFRSSRPALGLNPGTECFKEGEDNQRCPQSLQKCIQPSTRGLGTAGGGFRFQPYQLVDGVA